MGKRQGLSATHPWEAITPPATRPRVLGSSQGRERGASWRPSSRTAAGWPGWGERTKFERCSSAGAILPHRESSTVGGLQKASTVMPSGLSPFLALFFRGFRATRRRRRAGVVLSSRARASRLRPSARRSRGRSGLSRVERRPETPARRLTPKSTWLTLASGTRGGRKSPFLTAARADSSRRARSALRRGPWSRSSAEARVRRFRSAHR